MAEKGEGLCAGIVVDPLLLVVMEAAAVGVVCQHGWMGERVLLEFGAAGPPDKGNSPHWDNSFDFPSYMLVSYSSFPLQSWFTQ